MPRNAPSEAAKRAAMTTLQHLFSDAVPKLALSGGRGLVRGSSHLAGRLLEKRVHGCAR